MIEIDREDLIPLRQAASYVPSGRVAGKPVHPATVYRWASTGLNGVLLETVLIGGLRFTSKVALLRFIEQCNGGRSRVLPPPERDEVRERRTKHLLDKHLSGKRSPERLRWAATPTR
jgi:hypothetical protein